MNRLPWAFRSTPPSPRTDSVTRMPRTDGGQTMPVGWNCTNSMLSRLAPASRASACPSPVYSQEFEVTLNVLPIPPVARTTAAASKNTSWPVSRMYPNAPAILPDSSLISRVMVVSANTLMLASGSPAAASSCCMATTFCCRVRISSRPVRSPTWASRGYSWPPKFRWLILPSLVRSNSAPQASSSQMRSGASLACSSAIRQLFRNFPPRMVSRKCTCQLSLELALPIDAAQPPSAITVWALPNSDLQITATRKPCCRPSIAARRPAPPAPITSTSYACRSTSVIEFQLPNESEEPHVGDPPGRHQPDVQVGQRDPHQ